MYIDSLTTKIQQNQVYPPNQILLALINICNGIGFRDVCDLDVEGYMQGSTVTFWNENDESIQFENNIETPSIYMDSELCVQDYVKGKMTNLISKFNGNTYGHTITFNLKEV